MSRVGKKPILIPESVEIKTEGQTVTIKGPKGELKRSIRPEIKLELKEGKLHVLPQELKLRKQESKRIKAFLGLTRSLLACMVEGVIKGYEKKLEIEGVGYRVNLEGGDLVMKVGYSHPVKVKVLPGINFSVEKNTITVSGIDKELVSQMAAKIRKIQPPEPYKGKGIRYAGEVVKRKLGKKVVTTGT
jgi:large subunit ribosomal protein L6